MILYLVADVDDAVVAITINRTYRDTLSEEELYDATRGIWRLNPDRAARADYVFAVYKGEIKEVYVPEKWSPALTTPYHHRSTEGWKLEGRFEFKGKKAPETVRRKYVGKQMPVAGTQNPIRYLNI